jgi:hypothetical protein
MTTVNIQGTFKKDNREFNGLESVASDLTTRPHDRVIVIGIVETRKITQDVADGGTEAVTVRFTALEPVAGQAAIDARAMLDKAYSERTGRSAPPDTLFDDVATDPGSEPELSGETD